MQPGSAGSFVEAILEAVLALADDYHPVYGTFAPGASPFHIKGVSYQCFREHMNEDVPGGYRGVLAKVEDPRARAYFEQPFLSSSSYDLLPLLDAGLTAARIAGRPFRALVRDGATRQSTRDSSGVYRALLWFASFRLVAERIPRIMMQYLDFGTMTGSLTASSRFEGVVSGLPKPACAWFQSSIEGFAPVLLARAGARDVEVRFHRFEEERLVSRMPLMTARVHIKWND